MVGEGGLFSHSPPPRGAPLAGYSPASEERNGGAEESRGDPTVASRSEPEIKDGRSNAKR